MSDLERYGDYTTTEEDLESEHRPSLVGRMIKIAVILLLVFMCGLLAFRLIVSGYYPREMKKLYMTESLSSYSETHSLDVQKSDIEVPYDDNDNASFFADNLLTEEGAGAVQFSLRFGRSTMPTLAERLGLAETPETSASLFDFSLLDNLGNRYPVSYQTTATYLWYHTVKLCFDGVDLSDGVAWIRVDIYYTGDAPVDYSEVPYATVAIIVHSSEITD